MNRSLFFILTLIFFSSIAHRLNATDTVPVVPASSLDLELKQACLKQKLDQVKAAVSQGASVNATFGNEQTTCLMLASMLDAEIAKYLLTQGAQVNAVDSQGNGPLIDACFCKKNDIAQMLLDAGADPNHANNVGKTSLMYASRDGNEALVTALLAHHADVNASGVEAREPIVWASINDKIGTVKLLIDAGANLNPPSTNVREDLRPKLALLSFLANKGKIDMIDLFLAHGVDINVAGKDGETPLMGAIRSGNLTVIDYLLGKKADVNIQDDHGNSSLMLALVYDQEPIWQHILQAGAKLELRNKDGLTALMLACQGGYQPAIRFLIEQGADVSATDPLGNTALTYSANHGETEMEQLLEAKGANGSEIHILNRKKPDSSLSPARSWALAVGAIYAQTNGTNPEVLGSDNPSSKDGLQKRLKEDWNVVDKKTFLDQFYNLSTRGHHTEFRETGAKFAALSDEDFQKALDANPMTADKAKAIRSSYLKWKERTGLAWDLCRRANLINLGYAANYLNETEAWELLMADAQQTQSSFASWQEMNDNFLDGREIWAGMRDPKFEAASQLLLNPHDSNSPWNKLSWNTDLSAN